jgi:hypothetical protein
VAKRIVNYGTCAVSGIFGIVVGVVIGLLIDQLVDLRITGQGWFGFLCGVMITVMFGVGSGLLPGSGISNFLIHRIRINPVIGFLLGVGLFLGIIIGTVFGGLSAG